MFFSFPVIFASWRANAVPGLQCIERSAVAFCEGVRYRTACPMMRRMVLLYDMGLYNPWRTFRHEIPDVTFFFTQSALFYNHPSAAFIRTVPLDKLFFLHYPQVIDNLRFRQV
jgi:hypothetical protein